MFSYLLGTAFKDNIIEWILTCSSYKTNQVSRNRLQKPDQPRPFSLKHYIAFFPTLFTSNYIYQLKKGMTTHSSILAWRIPRTEEYGGLQSMGSQRVGHNWVTNTHISHISRVSWYQFVDNKIVKRFLIFFFERVADASHTFYRFW